MSCHASTVDFEVSSVLTVGQAYELRNVQHLLTGPVLTGYNSSDSRHWRFVPKRYIAGKVLLRWCPMAQRRLF